MRVRPRTARYTRCVEAYRAHGRRQRVAVPMRAWDETDDLLPSRGRTPRRRPRGDAARPRRRGGRRSTRPRPGTTATATSSTSERPRAPARAHSAPGERPVVGIVGAGAGRDGAGRSRSTGRAGRSARSRRATRPPGALPRAGHRRPRVRRGQRARRRRRAGDPGHPRRRRDRRRGVHPPVRGPGPGPHERRPRRGGAPAGAGRRDAGRRVPPARGVRRPRRARSPRCRARPSRSRATTSWRRTSRRWRSPSAACRCDSPPGPRRPTTRPPCWRRAASWRCSTRSARSPGSWVSTRPGRWTSTCRSSSRRSPTRGRSASPVAHRARRREATSGPSRRTWRRSGAGAPDALAVYRALLARDATIALGAWRVVTRVCRTAPDRTCRQPVTR